MEIDEIYDRVAGEYKTWVLKTFASEESLKAVYAQQYPALPFDRTKYWSVILKDTLNKLWQAFGPVVKSRLTRYDIDAISERLNHLLDYNLFSQVYLNLQDTSLLQYRVPDSEKVLAELQDKWGSREVSIFDKAKLNKTASTADDLEFNRDLLQVNAIQIIKKASSIVLDFRVSPIGSTPALIDSMNYSSLGIGGDPYLQIPEGFRSYYLTWDVPQQMIVPDGDKLKATAIDYPFISKSGGDTLNVVLFSRFVMASTFPLLAGYRKAFIPRMNSLLIVTDGELSNPLTPYTLYVGTRQPKEIPVEV